MGYKVVQWATDGVGKEALRGIIQHPLAKPQVAGVHRELSFMDSNMVGTAMPAVNAIPLVCRAAPSCP